MPTAQVHRGLVIPTAQVHRGLAMSTIVSAVSITSTVSITSALSPSHPLFQSYLLLHTNTSTDIPNIGHFHSTSVTFCLCIKLHTFYSRIRPCDGVYRVSAAVLAALLNFSLTDGSCAFSSVSKSMLGKI